MIGAVVLLAVLAHSDLASEAYGDRYPNGVLLQLPYSFMDSTVTRSFVRPSGGTERVVDDGPTLDPTVDLVLSLPLPVTPSSWGC